MGDGGSTRRDSGRTDRVVAVAVGMPTEAVANAGERWDRTLAPARHDFASAFGREGQGLGMVGVRLVRGTVPEAEPGHRGFGDVERAALM